MDINYPAWADTQGRKYAFLTIMEEVLLLAHNQWGKKFQDGDITEDQWYNFLETWFTPRHNLVIQEKLLIRTAWKDLTEDNLPTWCRPSNVFVI